MMVKSIPFHLEMRGGTEMENITVRVQDALKDTGLTEGIVTVFVQHTTASVLIIEDEPGIRDDTKEVWNRLIPADSAWRHNTRNHGEDNGHSHLRAQLQGTSVTIPFIDGAMMLGTWQQIVVLDFDTRARTRYLVMQVLGE